MSKRAGVWYRLGAVNVTSGSNEVVGVNTDWLNEVLAIGNGDLFTLDGKSFYEVSDIPTGEKIVLHDLYDGDSIENTKYAIIRSVSGTINTRLAGQIVKQFNQKQLFLDELQNWFSSTEVSEVFTDSRGETREALTLNELESRFGKFHNGTVFTEFVDSDDELTTIDILSGMFFKVDLNVPLTSIAFTNTPSSETESVQATIMLKQVTGANLVVWPDGVKWANGRPPVLSYKANTEDIIVLLWVGGDPNPYGSFKSGWLSA
ncbi:hypothetical protein [uncultured Psychrosphaera sp.]|uniref:hypothetical protein n=1 Tax=uncultured Psychrosphaera sp. TaxID=1403522 RepID=UPI0026221C8E|nr:hypothetical protein [uncultured Psychrosphaera sp.]